MPPTTKTVSAGALQQLALLRSDPRVASFVENCLVLRMPRRAILGKLEKDFGISSEMGSRFIRNVLKQWERQQAKETGTRKALMRATLEAFFNDCMINRKHLPALQALKELIRLDGLAEPDKIQLDVSTMTVDSAVKYIEEANEVLQLARARGVIEATAAVVPPTPDTGSSSGGDTH